MALVFSTALPVQFWLAGCDTFNEDVKDGLNDECWCQPWRCDQSIPIRFSDEPGLEYGVTVVDRNEILDSEIPIPEVSEGYYSLDLPLADYCDKKIQLLILESGSSSSGILASTLTSYGGWSNIEPTTGEPFRIPSYTLEAKERKSGLMSVPIQAGDNLDITLSISTPSTNSGYEFSVVLMQSAGANTQTIDYNPADFGVGVSGSVTESITATHNFDQVKIVLNPFTWSGPVAVNDIASITGLQIIKTNGTPQIDNYTFSGNTLSPWTNEGASGTNWQHGNVVDATQRAIVTNSAPGSFSKNLRESIATQINAGQTVSITTDFSVVGAVGSTLEVGFSDDGSTGWEWFTITSGVPAGGVLSNDANYIAFRQTRGVGIGSTTVAIDEITAFTVDGINFLGSEILVVPNTGWTQLGTGYTWDASTTNASVTFPKSEFSVQFLNESVSAVATKVLSIPAGSVRYNFVLTAKTDETPASVEIDFTLLFKNASDATVATISGTVFSESPANFTGIIEIPEDVHHLNFSLENKGDSDLIELEVTQLNMGSADTLAKTDCHFIKTSHKETKEIIFSNNRNYAGLIYEDISPAEEFSILVPCVFFHKRFPQEVKGMERTSEVVVTASKVKTQKNLMVKHSPDYFHEKLILILSHHNVSIDGIAYRKEEAYEKEEGDLLYPLKKATCWLTQKNSLQRNVL